jgi:type I restriction enzyme S subunit
MSDLSSVNWCEHKFGDLCQRIVNGGTPATDNPRFWGGPTPWVTGADFTANGIGEIRRFVSEAGIRASATSVVKAGNLLVVTRTGVGKLAIAPFDIAISQDVTGVYVDGTKAETAFVFYVLSRELDELRKLNQGTSINGIIRRDLESHVVRIPCSRSTQKKISAILTTIDTAIEQTEALIEKFQHIKAGLMHDLFTRGVLPSGQLRPPRDQAPELYQETAIGWIPKEWSVATLEALLAPVPNNIRSGPFGSALLKHELVEEGIPFLGIDNIHVERFSADFQRFVSERKFRELARYRVRPGDVVITIMGTVGRCCVVPAAIEIALSSKHLWTMTFDTERIIPELVCWQLNHSAWAQAWFRKSMQGGIMDAIQSSTLKTLAVPLPPLAEQASIQARFQQVTRRINQDSDQLEKLRKQKLGLMQDLLTGKVAVKLDSPDNVAAHA